MKSGGFYFFLQVFIVLAALLFGGAGYEIYVFLKTKKAKNAGIFPPK